MDPSEVILAYCDESLSDISSPDASCIKRANTYFGRRSASLIKEFCILLMTDSETVMVEATPYSNIGLTHCL